MEVLDFVKKIATDLSVIDEGNYTNRAFLAGGAPRDIDHQKNPKDYDIFVLANNLDDEERFLDKFEEEYNFIDEAAAGPYRALRNARVTNVYDFSSKDGDDRKVQVVFYREELITNNPLVNFGLIVGGFDLNICKIGVHQQGDKFKILKTKDYNTDKNNKIITNTPEYRNIENIVLRRRVANRARRTGEKLGYGVDVSFEQGNENLRVEIPQPVPQRRFVPDIEIARGNYPHINPDERIIRDPALNGYWIQPAEPIPNQNQRMNMNNIYRQYQNMIINMPVQRIGQPGAVWYNF